MRMQVGWLVTAVAASGAAGCRAAPVYARIALGAAFLSGIASLDYSVFSASAGALLLALHRPRSDASERTAPLPTPSRSHSSEVT